MDCQTWLGFPCFSFLQDFSCFTVESVSYILFSRNFCLEVICLSIGFHSSSGLDMGIIY